MANGTFEAGSWFDAGWWIGLTLISAAAWQAPPSETDTPQEGPSVEYALTALGHELVPAIAAIAEVGYKLKTAASQPSLQAAE